MNDSTLNQTKAVLMKMASNNQINMIDNRSIHV